MTLEWWHLLITFLLGAGLSLFFVYLYWKKVMQKQITDIQKIIKKEQIQQLSEAFGRKLPDSKINQILKQLEDASAS